VFDEKLTQFRRSLILGVVQSKVF